MSAGSGSGTARQLPQLAGRPPALRRDISAAPHHRRAAAWQVGGVLLQRRVGVSYSGG